MCVFDVSGTKTSSLNGYVFGSSYGWEESFIQPTVPQAAAVRKVDQTYWIGHSSTSRRCFSSFSYSRAPWAQVLWEYKDWNTPVSLILSLSPLQMSRCQLPESNRALQSFIQGCGMWVVCAVSPALAVPLAFIYAASVNIHLYPTAADDISHPYQAFVRQLNPVPIASAGQRWNGNLNSLLQSPGRQWPGPSASDQFHFLWISVNQAAARSLPWSVDAD